MCSYNASYLALYDNIPFVHYFNESLTGLRVDKQICTEACTGKTRIDTHFSYVNLKLKLFVLNGDDILTQDNIFDALSLEGVIGGSTAISFDGFLLKGPVSNR